MAASKALLLALALAACLAGTCRAQNFTIPRLPYPYDNCEPSIDFLTIDLHWNKHTATYATKLNDALAKECKPLRGQPLYKLISLVGRKKIKNPACELAIRRHGGGLYNHALFFLHNLAHYGEMTFDTHASPGLKQAIRRSFGSYPAFETAFNSAAAGVFGSGWVWVVYVPVTSGPFKPGRLVITTTPNQDNPLMGVAAVKGVPILGLDVWEHAYYLKYQNRRAEYTSAFKFVMNWRGMSQLYSIARTGTIAFLNPLLVETSPWGVRAG